jgi:phosphatidylserine/phosphatidylglycerophosphate/cardiolipin synthase-like enzyme
MIDFVQPPRPTRIGLISGRGHYEAVVHAALGAETSLWIATANLKDLWVETSTTWTARPRRRCRRGEHRSVLEVLDQLAARGVDLRILHAELPSQAFRASFDRHPRLVAGGLELRLCPRMHFKAVIVDGTQLYIGSANWTGAGLGAKAGSRRNFELGILTEDTSLLDLVQGLYDRVWRGLECNGCGRRELCEAPLDGEAR